MHLGYASQWKVQFGKGAGFLPAPPKKVPKEDDRLARRIQLELGSCPDALAALKNSVLGHAISATGLALWSTTAHPTQLTTE